MSLTAVVTGQSLLAVASGDRKFRDRHVSHAAARLNAKPMSVARATVAADVRHHKPLTMHEFNSCSGGCVSRSLATAKPMSVALAWLLQRSPNILLIPGTSSVEHLRENVAGAGLQLPHEAIKELNAIAG